MIRRFELEVTSPDDLSVRVIRSQTCRIEVPELGVEIDPGTAANSFITDVEGILERICRVLRMVKGYALEEGDQDKLNVIERLFRQIDAVKRGELAITLILEDESGDSMILSENVRTIDLR
ncbi:MAG: ZPR1 zinc finger domain-containing protein [Candidatus Syntropharchaeales archaeon]|nr:ZPR1 zinc finger domain-containing protein [Candidatus Syntrophoarchaeum sp.]